MKNRQQCTRVSWMYRSRCAVSSLRRYAECWSLIYLTMLSQLHWLDISISQTKPSPLPSVVVDLVTIARGIHNVET